MNPQPVVLGSDLKISFFWKNRLHHRFFPEDFQKFSEQLHVRLHLIDCFNELNQRRNYHFFWQVTRNSTTILIKITPCLNKTGSRVITLTLPYLKLYIFHYSCTVLCVNHFFFYLGWFRLEKDENYCIFVNFLSRCQIQHPIHLDMNNK